MMSCSVCVVIGPFIGWNFLNPVLRPGTPPPLFWSRASFMSPLGSPRSQASRSVRESTWHEAQAIWPRPEFLWVSYRCLRPTLIATGDGSWKGTRATSSSVVVETTEIDESNLLSTNRRELASSSTTPVGPSPTSIVGASPARLPAASITTRLFEPMPVT